MSKLIIVQRQTLNWSTMTQQNFAIQSKAFCRLWGRPDDYMVKLVDLWNQTFAISYFSAREKMKTIASSNMASIDNSQWIPYQGYSNIPAMGDAYLFIDDDDWLRPDITQFLSKDVLKHHAAALWKAATLGGPKSNHPVFFWGLNGRCMTNNYAINGSWLSQNDRINTVRQHGDAEKTLQKLDEKDVLQIDQWLSMTNKHPCSSVSLERGLQGDFTSARLITLIEQYCHAMATIDSHSLKEAPWSEPLVEATRLFFVDVLNSQRK